RRGSRTLIEQALAFRPRVRTTDGGIMDSPPPIPVRVNGLSAGYGPVTAIRDVTLPIHDRLITAIIGPSGCGKSTLIRCVNRMHEVTRGAFSRGEITLDDRNI